MIVTSFDGSPERRVLISLLTDPIVLGRFVSKYEKGLLKTKWGDLLASWAVKHFLKYQEAPKKHIEAIFEAWAGKENRDKETVEAVSKLLASFSEEYEKIEQPNSEFAIDFMGKFLNEVKVKKTIDLAQNHLDNGDLDLGIETLKKYGKVELGAGTGIDVLRDVEAWKAAYAEQSKSIVQYKGKGMKAMNRFIGDAFARDSLIAFNGGAKRGKTYFLLDLAWRAMLQRLKVAFFEIGDLSQNQIMRRFGTRAMHHPSKPKRVKIPLSISKSEGAECATCEYEEQIFEHEPDWQMATKACEEIIHTQVKTHQRLLQLVCAPAGKLSVGAISNQLEQWERDGWVADTIFIDYDKLLADPVGIKDPIQIADENWKQMRTLAMEKHALVATACQTNAAGNNTNQVNSRTHFSGSLAKIQHANGIIDISQTAEEKKKQIVRLSWGVLREDEYEEGGCINVAQCLSLANPCVRSCF